MRDKRSRVDTVKGGRKLPAGHISARPEAASTGHAARIRITPVVFVAGHDRLERRLVRARLERARAATASCPTSPSLRPAALSRAVATRAPSRRQRRATDGRTSATPAPRQAPTSTCSQFLRVNVLDQVPASNSALHAAAKDEHVNVIGTLLSARRYSPRGHRPRYPHAPSDHSEESRHARRWERLYTTPSVRVHTIGAPIANVARRVMICLSTSRSSLSVWVERAVGARRWGRLYTTFGASPHHRRADCQLRM